MTTIEIISIVLAGLALLIAFTASRRARSLARRLDVAESAARSADASTEEAQMRAVRTEEFLKRMADGRNVTAEMIEEGRLFDEIDAEHARRLVDAATGNEVLVLDVRTREEVEGGHIPGMLWVPINELQQRWREVPRRRKVLVMCAAGSRSASACDFLSTKGYEDLANVIGGMSAWRGDTRTGPPAP